MANNNHKRKYNWFTKMRDQYGPQFMTIITKQQIQYDAQSIIRDIVYNRIDYEEFGPYFMDPEFAAVIIGRAQDRQAYYDVSLKSIDIVLQLYANRQIILDEYGYNRFMSVKIENVNLYHIYSAVAAALISVCQYRHIDALLTINASIKQCLQMVKI